MRNFLLFATIIIIVLFGFVCGYYIYKENSKTEIKEQYNLEISGVNSETNKKFGNNIIATNVNEEKVSPNATLVIKKYYKECGHTTKDYAEIPEEMVNMNEKEIEIEFSDWEIKGFSPSEIVIFKEIEGICDEHFVLREKDGNVAIYRIDVNNNEILSEMTEISTEYLTENDLAKLEEGIRAIGREELNSILEDYE